MNKDIELNTLPSHKSDVEKPTEFSPQNPRYVYRKLVGFLLLNLAVSIICYVNYGFLKSIHPLLAPALLGMATAALAQSTNQYVKRKFSMSKILKFCVWGLINGSFTVMWIDALIQSIDNLVFRIMVDQLVGAPTFQLIFNILNSLWDHGELSYNTRNAYFKSLKYSYCYWPLVSCTMFVFIPQDSMFPANCAANLVWNLILTKLS